VQLGHRQRLHAAAGDGERLEAGELVQVRRGLLHPGVADLQHGQCLAVGHAQEAHRCLCRCAVGLADAQVPQVGEPRRVLRQQLEVAVDGDAVHAGVEQVPPGLADCTQWHCFLLVREAVENCQQDIL